MQITSFQCDNLGTSQLLTTTNFTHVCVCHYRVKLDSLVTQDGKEIRCASYSISSRQPLPKRQELHSIRTESILFQQSVWFAASLLFSRYLHVTQMLIQTKINNNNQLQHNCVLPFMQHYARISREAGTFKTAVNHLYKMLSKDKFHINSNNVVNFIQG